jgi:hypothetical protein
MYWYQFFSLAFGYVNRVYIEWKLINTFLVPQVEKSCASINYVLNTQEKKKVLKYYPLLSVCANADNYALLTNRNLTTIERKRITLVSAMATLCDDLLDEDGWLMEDLFLLLDTLQFKKPLHRDSKKATLIVLLNEVLLTYGVTDKFWFQLKKSLMAQSDSIKQNKANLSREETLEITKEKNGQTSLLVASLMDENWTELQLQIIYQSGVMGQLMNDIFDTYKDFQEGIYTIVSKVNSIDELKNIYYSELKKLHNLIRQLPLHKKGHQKIIRHLSPINTFGMVALHRMSEIELASSEKVEWKNLPRKQLLFDMAKWNNRFLYLKYMHIICKY